MENLKAALSEMSPVVADVILDKMFQFARNNEEFFHEQPWEVWEFIGNIARSLMGYRHGSDLYDAGGHTDVSAEYSDVYEPDLSDVKDRFGADLLVKLADASSDLKSIDGFDKVMELAQKSGFTGSAEDLESVLKKSAVFSDYVFRQVTEYDG